MADTGTPVTNKVSASIIAQAAAAAQRQTTGATTTSTNTADSGIAPTPRQVQYFTNCSTSPTGSRNHLASFRFQNTFRLNV